MKEVKCLLQMTVLLIFLVVVASCNSKGAIPYSSNTKDDINIYITETNKIVNSTTDSLEVVFHQAGSFQEYAKNVNKKNFKYGSCRLCKKDVKKLMKRSFEKLGADGIEIDAQTIPESKTYKNVYIVHDKINETKLSDMAKKYLKNNSLKQVLTYFIDQKYFMDSPSGKHLFLELKIPKKPLNVNHSPLNSEQKKYIEQIITEIQEAIESAATNRNETAAIRRHIGFASFNLYALEYAHAFSMKKMQDGYSFNFIAGTNRVIFGNLINTFKKEINYLNQNLTQRLITCKWLTGIWFDPIGINRIVKTFNNINKKRKKPLSIFISTYKLKRQNYFNRLRKDLVKNSTDEPIKLENVRGLIFDIRMWEN